MSRMVWIDGSLRPKAEAAINVYDHGLLYGDGVFEGIRAYGGKIFQRDAHIRRLYDSAKAIRLTIPYSSDEVIAAVEQTIKANEFSDCYIRLVATRGVGNLGLSPTRCPKASMFVIADLLEVYPREMYENGMSIITSSITRCSANSLSPRVKSLNYLNNILAKIEAIDAGVPEALMLNQQGNIAECTADNVFLVRDGAVYTPQTSDGILEGVTREVVMKLCRDLGLPCVEKTLQKHDLYIADECFLTGTGAEVIAVTQCDGRPIGSGKVGPITSKLLEAFRRFVRQG